jgi:uncharacterized protein
VKLLPQLLPIASFGDGGFRFGSMSHLGSLLVTPKGMRAWPIGGPLREADFSQILQEKALIDFVILGTGQEMRRPNLALRNFFAAENLNVDFMSTSSAVHTYNVMLAEGRRLAAAFVAVGP